MERDAAYFREKHKANPRTKMREKARQRAYRELAQKYEREFHRLYRMNMRSLEREETTTEEGGP